MQCNITIKPPVIAHRGASAFAPENTLAAFAMAKKLGCQWVEFDVTLAACQEVVVIHDDTLDRTTNGFGQVDQFKYADLKLLDAGSWFASQFAQEKIPTLLDTLNLLREQKLSANIEVKSAWMNENIIAAKVMKLIDSYPDISLLLSSFSREILISLRKHSVNVCLGYLMHDWENDGVEFARSLNCFAMNVNQEILTAVRVKEIKNAGFFLAAYTVNQVDRANTLYGWGVDAVFSDCPKEMLVLLESTK